MTNTPKLSLTQPTHDKQFQIRFRKTVPKGAGGRQASGTVHFNGVDVAPEEIRKQNQNINHQFDIAQIEIQIKLLALFDKFIQTETQSSISKKWVGGLLNQLEN